MGTWAKTHLGLLAILPLYLLVSAYPIHNGSILPDPFEILFDWAGEVGAHAYLSIVMFTINFAPVSIVAGCLDLAPPRHTLLVMTLLIVLSYLPFFNPFVLWFTPLCAASSALLAALLYLFIRFLKAQVSRQLPATA